MPKKQSKRDKWCKKGQNFFYDILNVFSKPFLGRLLNVFLMLIFICVFQTNFQNISSDGNLKNIFIAVKHLIMILFRDTTETPVDNISWKI